MGTWVTCRHNEVYHVGQALLVHADHLEDHYIEAGADRLRDYELKLDRQELDRILA